MIKFQTFDSVFCVFTQNFPLPRVVTPAVRSGRAARFYFLRWNKIMPIFAKDCRTNKKGVVG